MSSRTLFEFQRRAPNLRKSRIDEVLPEYFQEEYPSFVSFLKEYYEALDQPGEITDTLEYGLFALRDLDEINLKYIDRLFYEIANGSSSDYFNNPRLVGKLISQLLQNKGNELGLKGFFKMFFNDDVVIEYPKNNILYTFSGVNSEINKSIIGAEGLRYLTDGGKYQVLSILIKSGYDITRWGELYKRFVHPAGFYLSSEVAITSFTDVQESAITYLNDVDIPPVAVESTSTTVSYQSLTEIAGISDSYVFSVDLNIEDLSAATLAYLDSTYSNIGEITQLAGPTVDDTSLTVDNTIETADGDKPSELP